MYLLDTDHISLIQRGGAEGQRLLSRLANFPGDEIGVTVITYEEQVKVGLRYYQRQSDEKIRHLAI